MLTSWTPNGIRLCMIFQSEEKCRNLQEKLELAEQRMQQSVRKAEALPVVEEELAVRLAALNRVSQWSLSSTQG